ncbi:hypothetical protein C8J57DRAFT_1249812 [Mycena rebaudengoi]|nr:hypothetical protein C8J57DRAFT_1249812 [Mycena rebaudengoi]
MADGTGTAPRRRVLWNRHNAISSGCGIYGGFCRMRDDTVDMSGWADTSPGVHPRQNDSCEVDTYTDPAYSGLLIEGAGGKCRCAYDNDSYPSQVSTETQTISQTRFEYCCIKLQLMESNDTKLPRGTYSGPLMFSGTVGAIFVPQTIRHAPLAQWD